VPIAWGLKHGVRMAAMYVLAGPTCRLRSGFAFD
jgi:hypothetical protein